jgi:bacteriorhodopsin
VQIPKSTTKQIEEAAGSAATSGASLLSQVARSQWFWPSLLGVVAVGALVFVSREARKWG